MRRSAGLAAMITLAALAASACGGGDEGSSGEAYDSAARRSVETIAGPHLESVRAGGKPLSYEKTLAVAEPLGLDVVAGASRSERTVSIQLEHVYPGVLPFAAQDGEDCIMLMIRFPSEERNGGITIPGAVKDGEVSVTWVLIEDYVRNTANVPSAVCAAEAYSGMNWGEIPVSPDPEKPFVLRRG